MASVHCVIVLQYGNILRRGKVLEFRARDSRQLSRPPGSRNPLHHEAKHQGGRWRPSRRSPTSAPSTRTRRSDDRARRSTRHHVSAPHSTAPATTSDSRARLRCANLEAGPITASQNADGCSTGSSATCRGPARNRRGRGIEVSGWRRRGVALRRAKTPCHAPRRKTNANANSKAAVLATPRTSRAPGPFENEARRPAPSPSPSTHRPTPRPAPPHRR